jgi:cardiolipin synthase
MNQLWSTIPAIRADVYLLTGLVLAALATMHILLRKAEVRTAVGWIGLVWFAPIAGTALYVVFGVNRVKRRARALRSGEEWNPADHRPPTPAGTGNRLASLQHGIGRITGRPLLPGNAAHIFQNGDEAYPAMLAAIEAAQTSVALCSFIFHDDLWGGRFIDALTAARRRGVAVRVLIDGLGGGWVLSRAYRRLLRGDVPAARFFHSLLPWRMPFVNLRTHKKTMVVDGTLAFTGGMNIADANVQATSPHRPVLDTHFRLEGPVVGQLMEDFASDWAFTTGERLEGMSWFPAIPERAGAPARVIESGPDDDLEKVELAVLEAIACAQTRIAVMTPYFLPDDRITGSLHVAVMRGVDVELVIAHPSNHTLLDWAVRADLGPLLASGVRIWRCPPPFRHSKAAVVDDEWCLIGSANWDLRSFRLNFELCVEFYDPALAARLTDFMRTCRGPSLTLDELNARPLAAKLRDAAARLLLPYL